jgi:hypothetical protein
MIIYNVTIKVENDDSRCMAAMDEKLSILPM